MSLAQDYCMRRSVFGKLLVDHPLHMQTLARMEVTYFELYLRNVTAINIGEVAFKNICAQLGFGLAFAHLA